MPVVNTFGHFVISNLILICQFCESIYLKAEITIRFAKLDLAKSSAWSSDSFIRVSSFVSISTFPFFCCESAKKLCEWFQIKIENTMIFWLAVAYTFLVYWGVLRKGCAVRSAGEKSRMRPFRRKISWPVFPVKLGVRMCNGRPCTWSATCGESATKPQ